MEAWIELDPEDVLFVEGAEDFDRIGTGEATAVQVKDDRASGPLTLSMANGLAAETIKVGRARGHEVEPS